MRATLRVALAVCPAVFALAAFAYAYAVAYEYWAAHQGRRAWLTTWPAGRTRLVLLMFVVPAWAAFMAVATVLWVCISAFARRALVRRGYTPLHLELSPMSNQYTGDSDDENHEVMYTDESEESLMKHQGDSRRRRRCTPRIWQVALAFYVAAAAFGVYMLKTYEQPVDIRYRPQLKQALDNPRSNGYHTGEKIFIAANFYNNEAVLPYWIREVIKVVTYLGTDNVFVSVFESYSKDKTPELLGNFGDTLSAMGVPHKIVTRDKTIPKPDTSITNHARIEFLSAVRNRVMEPLYQNAGFDRILFSNDVFVEAESIIALLRTRNGDWDMVCSLDFDDWGLYDAWVIRDRLGGLVSSLWPYFMEELGMGAVEKDQPAPVFSCWNGIVGMRADPFYTPAQRANMSHPSTLSVLAPEYGVAPAQVPPLRFRTSVQGAECFSSECFLIPYDMRRLFWMDKIFVVPTVLVAYKWDYYVWFKWITRHWLVKWWIEKVESGNGYQHARVTMGPKEDVYVWDGGHCFSF